MDNFVVKYFDSAHTFLQEMEEYLYEKELPNSYLLSELLQYQKGSCGAVLDKKSNMLIFGLFASTSLIYLSSISTNIEKELYPAIVNLLVKDFVSKPFTYSGIQGYEPAITLFYEELKKSNTGLNLIRDEDVYSCVAEKVIWSPKSLEIKSKTNTFLHQATMEDQDLVISWTQDFCNEDAGEDVVHLTLVERWIDELKQGNVYILYYEGIPVCTARKRRPLRFGCTISLVYTPPEYRQKGYGSACVSMLTELLLREFKYVTLFADAERFPNNSIYTGIGYEIHSGAALYYTPTK